MRAIVSVVATSLICSVVTPLAKTNDTDDVRTVVNDLYAKLNATDADGFIEYMLPDDTLSLTLVGMGYSRLIRNM